jgi:hypothetical protein
MNNKAQWVIVGNFLDAPSRTITSNKCIPLPIAIALYRVSENMATSKMNTLVHNKAPSVSLLLWPQLEQRLPSNLHKPLHGIGQYWK